jgi:hypothetical protein
VPPYTVTIAPIANAQIEAALMWWNRNRRASRDVLESPCPCLPVPADGCCWLGPAGQTRGAVLRYFNGFRKIRQYTSSAM